MGRPSFKPTEEQRRQVQMLAEIGIPHEQLALFVGLKSDKTLRKHFRKELTLGDALATARVAEVAKEMATSGKFRVMTMFWLNTVGSAKNAKSQKPLQLTQIVSITKERDPRLEGSKQNAKGEWVHIRHLDRRTKNARGGKACVRKPADEGDDDAAD